MAATYEVERTTSIAAPPEQVFAHLVDYHRWGAWSPWEDLDPAMTKSYTGETGQIGACYHWTGNRKVGEGRMTTTAIDEPNRIEIDLEFVKPFKSQADNTFLVEPSGDGSSVTWRMNGTHTVLSRLMGIVKSMDSLIGPDFEKGLAKLKKVCEA